MNDAIAGKIGLGFAFTAFGFLSMGSIIAGATIITAFIRGGLGALIFGATSWILSYYLLKKDDSGMENFEDKAP